MTKHDDGGPAFPVPGNPATMPGMTLRQWYAGMALASLTAAPDYSSGPCNAAIAERAYAIADAMIAASKETP